MKQQTTTSNNKVCEQGNKRVGMIKVKEKNKGWIMDT
jgi:hypothetical protein